MSLLKQACPTPHKISVSVILYAQVLTDPVSQNGKNPVLLIQYYQLHARSPPTTHFYTMSFRNKVTIVNKKNKTSLHPQEVDTKTGHNTDSLGVKQKAKLDEISLQLRPVRSNNLLNTCSVDKWWLVTILIIIITADG